MFFHSTPFLFVFLPVVLGGYVFLEGVRPVMWRQAWLLGASLVFYGWANPAVLALLLPLTLVNYRFGKVLSGPRAPGGLWLVGLAVGLNVGVLAYFKYTGFLIGNLNALLRTQIFVGTILLPLGISFLTFMQIAWLVASRRREAVPCNYFEFLLYSMFFPQVVSGPIVYQRESLPQFRIGRTPSGRAADICAGTTLFVMGLGKKVLIADPLAPWADSVFEAAAGGQTIGLATAWIGALAYTFQIYFDFSGYSDMAIGTARLFGIRLPLNFNSPYKAGSARGFWRRWHMTLSRFLRDYVYIPLGGNRCSATRRSLNLFLTMLLGGFWHGAGWTFLLWGALHGVFLVVNHAWASLAASRRIPGAWMLKGAGGCLLTFVAVLVAWVFFRAPRPADAGAILSGLAGLNGVSVPGDAVLDKCPVALASMLGALGIPSGISEAMFASLALLSLMVFLLPNSQQILASLEPGLVTYGKRIAPLPRAFQWMAWRPSLPWLAVTTILFLLSLLNMNRESSFLYRNF